MNWFNINNNKYIIDETLESNDFVGIKVIDNEFHLSFPMGYEIDSKMLDCDKNNRLNVNEIIEYKKKILRYLYETVILAKSVEDNNKWFSSNNEEEFPIHSYLYILSDYFSNGLYNYNEIKYKKDCRGKINWKRTFQNSFFVHNNTPIYFDTVIRYNKKETNVITQLQIYCINKAMDIFVFMGDYSKIYCELDEDIKNNIYNYNNLLDRELKDTNNDKKKLLLMNIKNILNDCNCNNGVTRAFGTYNYKYAFEKMINKIFGSEENLSEYYPKAAWYLGDEKRKYIIPYGLREDTIWIGENVAYVIDSKYYQYGINPIDNLLPQTSVINKQIVYGNYVKSKLELKLKKKFQVRNIFVIPSNNDNFLEYKGYSHINLLEYDEPIYLLFVNMNQVVDKYLNNEYNQINTMIEIIEKNAIK